MTDLSSTTKTGTLRVNASFLVINLYYFVFKPRVSVDGGEEQGIDWGQAALQVPAGTHKITIRTKWILIPVGKATTTVHVPEGGTVSLNYRAPWFTLLMPGKITQG